MNDFDKLRSKDTTRHSFSLGRTARETLLCQRSLVVWLTGLSGSGKSTIADSLDLLLYHNGYHVFVLDGDNLRHGLNADLGFTASDRSENIRRVAEVAKLMSDAGLVVLVSTISPSRADRQFARELIAEESFVEVFVDTPIEECARRDPKGLYRKALGGELSNFTGIDSVYEIPLSPELHMQTLGFNPTALASTIHDFIKDRLGNDKQDAE